MKFWVCCLAGFRYGFGLEFGNKGRIGGRRDVMRICAVFFLVDFQWGVFVRVFLAREILVLVNVPITELWY